MLARAWFLVSVVWAALMFLAIADPNANDSGREWLAGFAVAPFILGLLLRWAFRYVVVGPRRSRQY